MTSIGERLIEVADGHRGTLVFHLDDEVVSLSATELSSRARHAAALLARHGVVPGDRVGLLGRNRPEWAVWAFATWLAGAVLVPLQLPVRVLDRQAFAERNASLVRATRCRRVLTEPEFVGSVADDVAVPWTEPAGEVTGSLPLVAPSDPALIQFTSGSTADPRGVVLTHGAVLAQLAAQRHALRDPSNEIALGWVPFFHDLGLIFFLLHPVLQLSAGHILPTERFARDPAEWLRLVSAVGATVTDAPPSAWAAALSAAQRSRSTLDLSSLQVAYFAGEPVDPGFVDRLLALAPDLGLDPRALGSTYGLAEAVLGVSATARGDGVRFLEFDFGSLTTHGRIVPPASSRGRLVSTGPLFDSVQVRIVDKAERLLPEDVVGEIQVTGASLMTGYLDRPASEGFSGKWVRTGDLGFLHDGELYVTGRAKDVLIVMGQNYCPEDFEWAADRVPGVRPGRSVAFTVEDGARIILLVEPKDPEAVEGLGREITRSVADAVGAAPAQVHLVRPGMIEKTTSGKVRRQAVRQLYEAGRIPVII